MDELDRPSHSAQPPPAAPLSTPEPGLLDGVEVKMPPRPPVVAEMIKVLIEEVYVQALVMGAHRKNMTHWHRDGPAPPPISADLGQFLAVVQQRDEAAGRSWTPEREEEMTAVHASAMREIKNWEDHIREGERIFDRLQVGIARAMDLIPQVKPYLAESVNLPGRWASELRDALVWVRGLSLGYRSRVWLWPSEDQKPFLDVIQSKFRHLQTADLADTTPVGTTQPAATTNGTTALPARTDGADGQPPAPSPWRDKRHLVNERVMFYMVYQANHGAHTRPPLRQVADAVDAAPGTVAETPAWDTWGRMTKPRRENPGGVD